MGLTTRCKQPSQPRHTYFIRFFAKWTSQRHSAASMWQHMGASSISPSNHWHRKLPLRLITCCSWNSIDRLRSNCEPRRALTARGQSQWRPAGRWKDFFSCCQKKTDWLQTSNSGLSTDHHNVEKQVYMAAFTPQPRTLQIKNTSHLLSVRSSVFKVEVSLTLVGCNENDRSCTAQGPEYLRRQQKGFVTSWRCSSE